MPRCNTGSSFACGTGGVAETSSSEGILTMTTSGGVSSSSTSPSNPFSCNFENSRNKSCQRAMTKCCLSFSDAKSSGFNLLTAFLNMVIENSAYCIIGVLWSREISTISLGRIIDHQHQDCLQKLISEWWISAFLCRIEPANWSINLFSYNHST